MQFIMVDVELIKNNNLTNDEIIAYALLCDRMKSSRNDKRFFDSSNGDYYVIYTLEQMAKSLKVSIRKVSKILTKLVKIGLLAKKKQFSKADKLFLPKFKTTNQQDMQSKDAKFAGPEVQNLQPNQSYLNQKNQSKIDTVNTDNLNKQQNSKIKNWKQSVCGKIGIKPIVVDEIMDFAKNDLNQAHKIIGVILNAKNKIAKVNGLLNSPISRFENNINLGTKLAIKLQHVFNYLPAKMEEQHKYIMTAMKKFFLEAFGIKKDELIKPNVDRHQNTKKEVIPAWMNNNDESKDITPEEKAEIEAKLQAFYRGE